MLDLVSRSPVGAFCREQWQSTLYSQSSTHLTTLSGHSHWKISNGWQKVEESYKTLWRPPTQCWRVWHSKHKSQSIFWNNNSRGHSAAPLNTACPTTGKRSSKSCKYEHFKIWATAILSMCFLFQREACLAFWFTLSMLWFFDIIWILYNVIILNGGGGL